MIKVRIHIQDRFQFKISFSNYIENELFFELPPYHVEMFRRIWGDDARVARAKGELMSSISLVVESNGIKRLLRLELDKSWLSQYS